MTDRISGLTVVLDRDIRIDDAQALIKAISMFSGVIDVLPNVASADQIFADSRARRELGQKLFEVLYPPKP